MQNWLETYSRWSPCFLPTARKHRDLIRSYVCRQKISSLAFMHGPATCSTVRLVQPKRWDSIHASFFTWAGRHRVLVSPPFFFVFYFLVVVVLRVRYANAEPTGFKRRNLVPSAIRASRPRLTSRSDRSWCSLLVLFLHVRVPSLCTIYIHFVAFKVTTD